MKDSTPTGRSTAKMLSADIKMEASVKEELRLLEESFGLGPEFEAVDRDISR